ncbi:MAG: hypothetical protein Q8R88_05475 [Desulfoprunum sp.]|nr:hypothetical protein [Desulfoprunum sp.]
MCPQREDAPLEVQLVTDVKNCRSCGWFWDGILPYGPYPSFDWQEQFPARFREVHEQIMINHSFRLMDVQATGSKPVEPAIMHGCRKAPIMTIGINPNLTSYFPSTTGARWAYPSLSDPMNYAYYYRFQTIYQESFDLEFIRESIVSGTEIVAERDGWLTAVRRCTNHRWLELSLRYADEENERKLEVAWTPEARYVVLVERREPEKGVLSFRQGDILAAKLAMPETANVPLNKNSTGYYQRFIPVLQKLSQYIKEHLGDDSETGTTASEIVLRIGEDVSQNDMVACASPGWSDVYDIPRDVIAGKCVHDKAFAISQIIQSRPAVLVIVGGSAMEMFGASFKNWIDVDYEGREIFQLLKETCTRKKYLAIEIGSYSLKTRLIICPHFSYPENFRNQARFSTVAWTAFQADFAQDVAILARENRMSDKIYNEITAVAIDGGADPIRSEISTAAWGVIMAYYCDPYQMIADALIEEYGLTIAYNPETGHLERSQGQCNFCTNELWNFTGQGCLYNKGQSPRYEPGYLENIVQQVLRGKVR